MKSASRKLRALLTVHDPKYYMACSHQDAAESPTLFAMIDPNGFLMIEPALLPKRLVNDSLTRKTAAVLRHAKVGRRFRGFHECVCGARSGNAELFVTIDDEELLTNSLAVHYIAWHRDEIPPEQLALIARLNSESEPTSEELCYDFDRREC